MAGLGSIQTVVLGSISDDCFRKYSDGSFRNRRLF